MRRSRTAIAVARNTSRFVKSSHLFASMYLACTRIASSIARTPLSAALCASYLSIVVLQIRLKKRWGHQNLTGYFLSPDLILACVVNILPLRHALIQPFYRLDESARRLCCSLVAAYRFSPLHLAVLSSRAITPNLSRLY